MKSKYFEIHELVPKHIFNKYGEKAWRFVCPTLIASIDTLKEHFSTGTMTINNYHWNGSREWSGIRTPESKWYSETSMHSFGKAVDCIFSDYTSEEVRLYILNRPGFFPYIKGIEMKVSWVHIDCRNENTLQKFYP